MLLLAAALLACAPRARLQLYESAPVETTLDHADLPEAGEVWAARIGAARLTLDLAHFYAVDREGGGSRLTPVIAAIEAAAARGVQVRFLADAKFHDTYPDLLDRLDGLDRVEVRLLDLGPRTGGVQHAKYMVVDGRRVLFGSQNFDWRSLEHVQELGAEVDQDEIVDAFEQVFAADWALAGGETTVTPRTVEPPPRPAAWGESPVRLSAVFSPQGLLPDPDTWDLPRLVAMIDGATSRVRVQLMSYKTHEYDGSAFLELDQALRRAAARGVQVELLLAHWSQKKSQIGTLQELQQVPGIAVRLATVPAHSGGHIPFGRVIHAKYMVVDGREAWIGTSNWSGEYFYKSRNVGLILDGEGPARRLDAFFLDLWNSPYAEEVDPARVYPEPRVGE